MKKDLLIQQVRALCIIAVVFIHIPYEYAKADAMSNYWIAFRQLIDFPVAIFFFLSGYFIYDKLNNEGNKIHFIFSRTKRLIIPFFIWSSFYLIIDILLLNKYIDLSGNLYFFESALIAFISISMSLLTINLFIRLLGNKCAIWLGLK